MAEVRQIMTDKLEFTGFLSSEIKRETKIEYQTLLVERFNFNKGDMVKITIERVPTIEKGKK